MECKSNKNLSKDKAFDRFFFCKLYLLLLLEFNKLTVA